MVASWGDASDALRNGQADLIPNQGITPERQKWLAFTSPVETFPIVIWVRQTTSNINSQTDLRVTEINKSTTWRRMWVRQQGASAGAYRDMCRRMERR